MSEIKEVEIGVAMVGPPTLQMVEAFEQSRELLAYVDTVRAEYLGQSIDETTANTIIAKLDDLLGFHSSSRGRRYKDNGATRWVIESLAKDGLADRAEKIASADSGVARPDADAKAMQEMKENLDYRAYRPGLFFAISTLMLSRADLKKLLISILTEGVLGQCKIFQTDMLEVKALLQILNITVDDLLARYSEKNPSNILVGDCHYDDFLKNLMDLGFYFDREKLNLIRKSVREEISAARQAAASQSPVGGGTGLSPV